MESKSGWGQRVNRLVGECFLVEKIAAQQAEADKWEAERNRMDLSKDERDHASTRWLDEAKKLGKLRDRQVVRIGLALYGFGAMGVLVIGAVTK